MLPPGNGCIVMDKIVRVPVEIARHYACSHEEIGDRVTQQMDRCFCALPAAEWLKIFRVEARAIPSNEIQHGSVWRPV